MKDMVSAPLRTISLVLGLLLILIGMVSKLTVSGNDLAITNPWFKGTLIIGGVAIAGLALFARGIFEEPKEGDKTTPHLAVTPSPDAQAVPAETVPHGLYRWDEPPALVFSTLLKKAARVSVSGRTAVNILSRNEAEVRALLRAGGQLRLLVLDPSAADRLQIYTEPTADLKENLSKGLKYATSLAVSFPGRVQIRTTSRPPTLGLVWIESSDANPLFAKERGVVQIKLYLDHSVTGAGRPNIAVASSDPWYRTMTEDFESEWNSASAHTMAEGS